MTPPAPSAECGPGNLRCGVESRIAYTGVDDLTEEVELFVCCPNHKDLIAALRAEVERLRDTLELAVSCIDRVPHPEEDWSWHNKDDPNMEKWAADVKKARSALAGKG